MRSKEIKILPEIKVANRESEKNQNREEILRFFLYFFKYFKFLFILISFTFSVLFSPPFGLIAFSHRA